MKKKYFNLVLALTIVVAGIMGATISSNAETSESGWEVSFNGKGFDSDYAKNKSNINNAMPGDTVNYAIKYTNSSKNEAAFYMNADVVKTLEDGSKASGGAYSYKITNEIAGKTSTIIDSETVGGDPSEVIGLDQVNGKGGTYFSLGKLGVNESGSVKIEVLLDGNSQTNDYMSTLAKINVKFGAESTKPVENHVTVYNYIERIHPIEKIVNKTEKVTRYEKDNKEIVKTLDNGTQVVVINDDEVPLAGIKRIKDIINKPDSGITIEDEPTPLAGGSPRTGDSIIPLAICLIMLVAGISLIIWYFKLTKNNKEEA